MTPRNLIPGFPALLIAGAFLCACNEEPTRSVDTEGSGPPGLPPPGTPWQTSETEVSFNPATCVRGSAGIGWGMGSSRVTVLGRENAFCILEYTAEVEGGWSRYRVRVPVTEGNTFIRYEPSIERHGTTEPGIVTSFELREEDLVDQGNLLLPPPAADSKPTITWTQEVVENTIAVNYFSVTEEGEGPEARVGSEIAARIHFFANEDYEDPLIGDPGTHALDCRVGDGKYGPAIDTALEGMKAGSVHYLQLHPAACKPLTRMLGGWHEIGAIYTMLEVITVD